MLEAKASRLRRRGEAPIDVEAEAARLLAPHAETPPSRGRHDAELRAEVRQLVLVRNERRHAPRPEPLDVEAETERQLADLIGSRLMSPAPRTTSTRSRSCWCSPGPTSTPRPRSWSSSTTPPRSTRRSSTWRPTRAPTGCGSPTRSPIDEDGRDRVLEAFQTHYHPGSTGSVSETALEQGDEELDEDEDGQDPGRED